MTQVFVDFQYRSSPLSVTSLLALNKANLIISKHLPTVVIGIVIIITKAVKKEE